MGHPPWNSCGCRAHGRGFAQHMALCDNLTRLDSPPTIEIQTGERVPVHPDSAEAVLPHHSEADKYADSVSVPCEVRVVDPETGGEKGSKLARWDLMPFDVLNELAEHFGIGARKYDDRNWERGYDWGLSLAALCRHLSAWAGGEDTDSESGDSHLIAVMWHAAALRWFQIHHKGTDNRP